MLEVGDFVKVTWVSAYYGIITENTDNCISVITLDNKLLTVITALYHTVQKL